MAISAKKFRNELKKNGVFCTDEALAKEMKALIPDGITEVYDPTCGDGSLLSVFADNVQKYGQDILAEQVQEAQQRLKNFHGVVGDTLLNPAFPGRKFPAIVANPPFSTHWNPDEPWEKSSKNTSIFWICKNTVKRWNWRKRISTARRLTHEAKEVIPNVPNDPRHFGPGCSVRGRIVRRRRSLPGVETST